MAETAPLIAVRRVACLATAIQKARDRQRIVSASSLALHLDCSRTYIGRLEADGVIHRQGDGFPLDQSRVAYLRYLRCERRQDAVTALDARRCDD